MNEKCDSIVKFDIEIEGKGSVGKLRKGLKNAISK